MQLYDRVRQVLTGRAPRILGLLLSIAGLVFVAYRIVDYGSAFAIGALGASQWLCAVALVVGYALSIAILARAWQMILIHLGVPASTAWSATTFGISQIAKYVPGNVFHLASRQAIGMSAGHSGWAIAKSSLYELALIASAGLLNAVVLAGMALVGVGWVWCVATYGIVLFGLFSFGAARVSRAISYSFVLYSLFLCGSGLIFVLGMALLGQPIELAAWPKAIGIYAGAWLAGFVTPGSPAGIGIREFVIVALWGSSSAPEHLFAGVVLARIVNTLGDALFYLGALWYSNQRPTKPSSATGD